MSRRFPHLGPVKKIRALAYVYAREAERDVQIAGVLTEDEARRIATNS